MTEIKPLQFFIESELNELYEEYKKRNNKVIQLWDNIKRNVAEIFQLLKLNIYKIDKIEKHPVFTYWRIYLPNGWILEIDPNQQAWSKIKLYNPNTILEKIKEVKEKYKKGELTEEEAEKQVNKAMREGYEVILYTPYANKYYKEEMTYEGYTKLLEIKRKLEEILGD